MFFTVATEQNSTAQQERKNIHDYETQEARTGCSILRKNLKGGREQMFVLESINTFFTQKTEKVASENTASTGG